MQLRTWQQAAVRRTLGLYLDPKNSKGVPGLPWMSFSHSIQVTDEALESPLHIVAALLRQFSDKFSRKQQQLELILTSASLSEWKEKLKLWEEKNGK